ncbi:GGDEF domain-containing protein [uncultured Maritalea sp.]|jgi:diguanylate cyclase (GGDEF)-like protein|uniref:GGDEF domain-containing protein n=1 Tax=uncultured Maritalea sp. TaxID=757249 RepID=UPI00263577E5|nr:GGDEF domain-containing protein [uncultured Maritalea sp.]
MAAPQRGFKFNLAIGIYVLCAAIVVGFAGSNFYVLNAAGDVANQVQFNAEANLVSKEVKLQLQGLASDQAEISFLDETVFELYRREIDLEYVQEEIAEDSWLEHEFEHVIIVDEQGNPQITIFRDQLMEPRDGLENIVANFDLIQRARTKYFANRKVRGKGFVPIGDPVWSNNAIYAADYRMVEGQLGMAVAQAIVPDILEVLPDGNPKILFIFRPLNKFAFGQVREQLGLSRFSIVAQKDANPELDQMVIGGVGSAKISAVWEATKPSAHIWEKALPFLAGLLALITVGLGFIGYRYSKIVTRIQVSEERNRFMAEHDALTGLPNRLQFDNELDNIIAKAELNRCAIICTDLDKFKDVNDTYGHQAGDAVIKTVAQRIANVVGDKGMAARVGGDEFIILLRDGLDEESVMMLCDNIIETVCEEVVFDNGSAEVGASIGVAWWPDDALTAKSVIRSADQALYRAKELGRGQTVRALAPNETPERRHNTDRRKSI